MVTHMSETHLVSSQIKPLRGKIVNLLYQESSQWQLRKYKKSNSHIKKEPALIVPDRDLRSSSNKSLDGVRERERRLGLGLGFGGESR